MSTNRKPTRRYLDQLFLDTKRNDDMRSVIRGTMTHEEYSRRWADEDRKRLERLPKRQVRKSI